MLPLQTIGRDQILVSIDEAARRMSVSSRTVRRMAHAGHLPTIQCRRRRLVPTSALVDWVDRELAAQRGG